MKRHYQEMTTLGEALPHEMARVRDEIIPLYIKIGPAGAFGLILMHAELDRGAKAMIEGDVVEMLRCYESLKEFTA